MKSLARDKGRDLYNLSHALLVFDDLDMGHILAMFQRYLDLSGQKVRRAQAQQPMFAKLAKPRFLLGTRPLLSADQSQAVDEAFTAEAFRLVFVALIIHLPGESWIKIDDMKDRFKVS
jgi:hypothetical protein